MLCEKTGMKKVFFSNSGAEANECAIKTARKYYEDKHDGKSGKIITLTNSFHGRTITTLAATGQEVFHKNFIPLTDGFLYVNSGDVDGLKQAVNENDVAAIMLECIQGEGGVNVVPYDFIKAIDDICKQNDILLIVDEVQTGNGRTGKTYAYMHYDVLPDIVTTAKGLGGGLPIGACIMGEKVKNTLTPSSHGSTYGGNPVCSAGALNVLSRITDDLLNEVNEKSKYIINELSSVDGVESVSGMGLMLGIKTTKPAKEVVNDCLNLGVLCLTAKDKIRLLPALNIPFDTLKQAVSVIKQAILK